MTLRAIAKSCIASAYRWAGASHWLSGIDATEMPFIVAYHRVVEDFTSAAQRTIPSMLVSTKMFEKHLDWLGRRFMFVSLDDIALHLENGRRFRRPATAITFDDGYADMYHHAFPILKRKGIPAAVFVVTDLIGTNTLQVHDRLYRRLRNCKELTRLLTTFPQRVILERLASFDGREHTDSELSALTWEMIEELRAGGITFGSHTSTHVLLTTEPIESARRQLLESKRTLEQRLNRRVDHIAYPDGRFNGAILDAVDAAGYRFGYTVCRTRNPKHPLLTIPRKVLWEGACTNVLGRFSGSVLHSHANAVFDSVLCEHVH